MNHKYLSSNNFEIVNNIFEVDEDIAKTISILNKKGYYTKFCCSGHIKDPRLYEMYNKKNDVVYDDFNLGYIVNNYEDGYDILIPYTFTTVYIMFNDNYNFINLPPGFRKTNDQIIETLIHYYSNGKRKNWYDIDKEIKLANELLLKWALSLPELNTNNKKKIFDKSFVEDWLNKLKMYWFNKEVENATALFSKTTFYQETPFMDPYTTYEQIIEEWKHIKDENIQNIELIILAIDGYTVIVQWKLKQNNEDYDGIYEIKFNDKFECIYFKSWEMCK